MAIVKFRTPAAKNSETSFEAGRFGREWLGPYGLPNVPGQAYAAAPLKPWRERRWWRWRLKNLPKAL
jgi:hypothetical protein